MSSKNRIPAKYTDSPEAAMAREHQNYQAWGVQLYYRENFLEAECEHEVLLLVRAPDPAKAMFAARMAWAYYTKEQHMKPGEERPEYPMLDDRCDCMAIDDSDYMRHWKDSKHCRRYWVGHKENPIAFAYFQ